MTLTGQPVSLRSMKSNSCLNLGYLIFLVKRNNMDFITFIRGQ